MGVFEIKNIAFVIFGYPISYVEFIGTVFGLISVFYAAKSNILTWGTGLVNEVFLFILFYQIQLYSDMVLQVYYFIVTLYGWSNWRSRSGKNKISTIKFKSRLLLGVVILLGTVVSGYFFRNIHIIFPKYFKVQAAYPFVDSFIMISSVVATILLAMKKIETWFLWVAIDLVCAIVYFKKNVYFLSLEYLIFLCIASYGLIHWRKLLNND